MTHKTKVSEHFPYLEGMIKDESRINPHLGDEVAELIKSMERRARGWEGFTYI